MIRVASFDVLDTCLTRACGSPTTLFYHLGRRVLERLGQEATDTAVEHFVSARISAEEWCRSRGPSEEVSLGAIWDRLRTVMGWRPGGALEQVELDTERENLRPVLPLKDVIGHERAHGRRVVFVSDTYLPAELLKGELLRYGLAAPDDGFYFSSEVGLTKGTGNLYSHVLEAERVRGREVLHVGDNHHADLHQAARAGLRARRSTQADPTSAEASVLESGLVSPFASRHLAGAMRAFRLSVDDAGATELIASFLGPFSAVFSAWVLGRARDAGIERLYFLSRDCQLTCEAAKVLAPAFGGIDCRYLHVSRQALFLPSSGAATAEEMPWMRRSWEAPILGRLLSKLELDYAAVGAAIPQSAGVGGDYVLNGERDWAQFWEALNQPPTRDRILARIHARRSAAIAYFRGEGLLEPVKWALVDLGRTLTCQEALWRILKVAGWEGEARGYYLGLGTERRPESSAGRSEAMFYDVPRGEFAARTGNCYFSNVNLLEHVVGIANHGTVHHYEETEGTGASARFAPEALSLEDTAVYERLSRGLKQFARECLPIVGELADPQRAGGIIQALVSSFVARPGTGSVAVLRTLRAGADQNNLDASALIRPLSFGEAISPILPRGRRSGADRERDERRWTAGDLCASPAAYRRVYRLSKFVERLRLAAARRLHGLVSR